eukprot:1146070-Pelagomonas_calceolata.AAC.6
MSHRYGLSHWRNRAKHNRVRSLPQRTGRSTARHVHKCKQHVRYGPPSCKQCEARNSMRTHARKDTSQMASRCKQGEACKSMYTKQEMVTQVRSFTLQTGRRARQYVHKTSSRRSLMLQAENCCPSHCKGLGITCCKVKHKMLVCRAKHTALSADSPALNSAFEDTVCVCAVNQYCFLYWGAYSSV